MDTPTFNTYKEQTWNTFTSNIGLIVAQRLLYVYCGHYMVAFEFLERTYDISIAYYDGVASDALIGTKNLRCHEQYPVHLLFKTSSDGSPMAGVVDAQKCIQFLTNKMLKIACIDIDVKKRTLCPFDISGCSADDLRIKAECTVDLSWCWMQCKTPKLTVIFDEVNVPKLNCFPEVETAIFQSRLGLSGITILLPVESFPKLKSIECQLGQMVIHPNVSQYSMTVTVRMLDVFGGTEQMQTLHRRCIESIDKHVSNDIKDIRISFGHSVRRAHGIVDAVVNGRHHILPMYQSCYAIEFPVDQDVNDAYTRRYTHEIAMLINKFGLNIATCVWKLLIPSFEPF